MKSAQSVLNYFTDYHILRGVKVFKLSVLPIVSSVLISFAKSDELLLTSYFLLLTSYFLLLTSYFLLLTSYFS